MIYGILFTLLVIDCVILGAAILLQAGKGGGMAASFGGASSSADQVLGARQAGNFLTAASWWAGGIFLFLSFVLAMMSSRNRVPQSVLDQPSTVPVPAATSPAPSATAPVLPLEKPPVSPTTKTAPAPRP